MNYKILSTRADGDTIFTEVIYDFDGPTVTVEIPHFMPDTQDDIIAGILNRANSEQRKLDAAAKCVKLIDAIKVDVAVDLIVDDSKTISLTVKNSD